MCRCITHLVRVLPFFRWPLLASAQTYPTRDKRGSEFKVKAIEGAIMQVQRAGAPLAAPADVDALPGLGAKTRSKLKEIIATGRWGREPGH